MTSMGGVGAPGATFLASVEATAAGVAERREQVRVLIAQLSLFDDQLAAFETSLQPVLEWSRTLVRMQEQALDPFGLARRRKGS